MRAKSSGFFGNSEPTACGTLTFHRNGASALRPSSRPMAATPTANCDRWPMGLMITISTTAPSTNANAALATTASHTGTSCLALSHQPKNADIIAISPCAKLRWPVPRYTITSPSASRL